MQYLASSPRHMPTYTNTHKKGSNPPFLSPLGSQAQLKVKHKNRFSPPSTRNSSAHPQHFYWSWTFISDADLNQVLTATVLAPRVRHCAHAMQSQPHLLLLFLHGSLWGHTRPDTISTLLRTHLPRCGNGSDCSAGNPIYHPRSVTVPGALPCMSQSATRRSVAARWGVVSNVCVKWWSTVWWDRCTCM